MAQLIESAPRPTHHGLGDTFLRLYFDRIFAALSTATGIALLGAAGLGVAPAMTIPGSGALLTVLGAAYLLRDISQQKNRYSNLVVPRLGEAAKLVRDITGAHLVVFGHTHVEVGEPGYVNLGSFGFARGQRPFLALDSARAPRLLRAS